MSIILPNNRLTMQLPQPRIVIRASCNQVRGIGAESTVPDPSLMAGERAFQLEWLRSLVIWLHLAWNRDHGFEIFDFPDLGGVVGGAGGEVLDVGREEDASYVVFVGGEVGYWDEGCLFAVLEEMPDVDVALMTC
jgi:hypothetical protein